MSKVIMVEGGLPIGMPTGDPEYSQFNLLPNKVSHPGFTPDLNVIRREITLPTTDVTPRAVQGVQRWTLTKGNKAGRLVRVHPPADTNDTADMAYANQIVDPLQAGVIYTPPEVVAAHPYTPTRKSIFPIRQPMECIAAMFWFIESGNPDPEDMAEPAPVPGISLTTEESPIPAATRR